ncbi:hypothetical protein Trydic_g4832 [Trypoxylus dichotomus]
MITRGGPWNMVDATELPSLPLLVSDESPKQYVSGITMKQYVVLPTEHPKKNVDIGNLIVLVLLDSSKAFDRIDHSLLLAILHNIGFCEIALRFFRAYLLSRKEVMIATGQTSDWGTTRSGVPQGSISDPLLVSIYTAYMSLFYNFMCNIHLDADGFQLYRSFSIDKVHDIISDINRDLNSLYTMLRKLCLTLNENK